ncbi:hypothetical protein [Actinocorallia herbida]|uniref:hypothetical protein n=1 Tax=Actinocorallia herbida TaxID=58109 RepID=UPI000F4CACF0|nr:hypothetical protein [Actinocorallia herbida]
MAKGAGRKAKKATWTAIRFHAQTRPRIDGPGNPGKVVGTFTDEEVLNEVDAIARTRLNDVTVSVGGGALPVTEALWLAGIREHQTDWLLMAVDEILREAGRLQRSDPYGLLIGEDFVGSARVRLSAKEWTLRIVEAVVTAHGQVAAHGLDPSMLLENPLRAAMVAFTRKHVRWNGQEQGPVYELIQSVTMSGLRFVAGEPVHQVRLLKLDPRQGPADGFDSFLPHPQLWVSQQAKAYSTPRKHLSGGVSVSKSGGVRTVSGPDALKQIVSDGIRTRHTDHWAPVHPIDPFPGVGRPTDTTLWRPVSPLTIVTISTRHVTDFTIGAITGGLGRATHLDLDLNTAMSKEVRDQLEQIAKTRSIPRYEKVALIRGRVAEWLDASIPDLEAEMLESLAGKNIRDAVGRTPLVRLYAGHQVARRDQIFREAGLIAPEEP